LFIKHCIHVFYPFFIGRISYHGNSYRVKVKFLPFLPSINSINSLNLMHGEISFFGKDSFIVQGPFLHYNYHSFTIVHSLVKVLDFFKLPLLVIYFLVRIASLVRVISFIEFPSLVKYSKINYHSFFLG